MSVIPPEGAVSLQQKQEPVCTTEPPYSPHYAYTRAKIDTSAFKSKLLNLPAEMWEDGDQEGNVAVRRPAHDKWGIKKIVFTFCDDFLLKVLDLPWSMDESWAQHLDPIYAALGVDKNRVVRSLLASMPPGMSIPVHHDTGLWVKHTHRIHVPIITGDKVDFFVGPNEESLVKYFFPEGHIIEINNQAKHAVDNNLDCYRVHLIFDYVEDYPLSRYKLRPGQVLHQTRRSIDFAEDEGSRKAPGFIIIGSQKCGTTSLYEYICQHPLVLRGKRRETHYFDWRWNEKLPIDDNAAHLAYYMNFFEEKVLKQHPSIMTGESTPSYMLHSDIVLPRLQRVVPWVKLLVMLRNPVDRAYSHYQMSVDMTGTTEQQFRRGMSQYKGKTFEELVQSEIDELNNLGITADTSYEEFRAKFLVNRPMQHGGHSLVGRGLYALQLEPYLREFASQIKVMSIKHIQGNKNDIQKNMNDVFNFIGLPPHDLEDTSAKNSRKYSAMQPETRAILERFYEPHNARLFSLLGYKFDW